jgi:putative phosphoesterase
MRIGILADTHSQVARTELAVAELIRREAGALFHCGDLLGIETVRACAALSTYFVWGNNDADPPALRQAIEAQGGVCLGMGGVVRLGGRALAMTHGHSKKEIMRLLQEEPDYLFVGHSHKRMDRREGKTRVINPGALHRAPEWTVAVLDLQKDHLEFVRVEK